MTEALLIHDEAGRLHFENDQIVHPFETLGTFLGYMSGPIIAESAEERQARLKDEEEMLARAQELPEAMPQADATLQAITVR